MMKTLRPLPLVLLSPLLLAPAIALGVWINATVWAAYETTSEITLSDYDAGANADVTADIEIPAENLLFDELITFYPPQWGIAAEGDVEVGTVVGDFSMDATVGLLNGACNNGLPISFELVDADTGMLPGFLSQMFPGLTPRARYHGEGELSGGDTFVNILVFEPGTTLFGVDFPADWGYGSVTVLNVLPPPGTPPSPSPVTDFCAPLSITETIYGTAAAVPIRTNPPAGGSYTFRVWSRGALDGDGDGYENAIDTCPFDVNVDASPRTSLGDPDGDGIDSACDPGPAALCWADAPGVFNDCDGDAFYNRGDNCPLIANENQADADNDRIGDACDPDPDDPYGYPGQDFTNELEVEISGPGAGETPTPTPTPSPTPGATGTPTPAITGTPTPGTATVEPGETCAPVIPATYNGLVRLNGVPAASGYEIIATIGGTEWGSAVISGGRYAIDVPEKLPASGPCFVGDTIAFFVDGAPCTPVVQQWSSGLHDVDLSCVTVPTPTPIAPTAVPTATATVPGTPVQPPPSGGGGLTGEGGVSLWAMALAGWAGLMAVAGLGTLARRGLKR